MTKILVTGATGFIGKHLMPALIKAGYEVNGVGSISGDITKAETWSDFPKCDYLIHLAGRSFVPLSWSDPSGFIQVNLMGTIAALDYCRKYNAKLIFLSSYLYGNPPSLPIAESCPIMVSNPYGLSKKLAEDACSFYSGSYGVPATILRPFNVYGPGQNENFLIPSIIQQVLNADKVTVKDLEPKRDYIYIDDLISAILKSLNNVNGLNIFNVGSGISYSVADLIRTVQQIKQSNLPVVSGNERRKDEIMDTIADISKAKRELGWEPKCSLEQGIKKMFKNYEK